jgi:Plasmid pRiA4b ORF-3-like protein
MFVLIPPSVLPAQTKEVTSLEVTPVAHFSQISACWSVSLGDKLVPDLNPYDYSTAKSRANTNKKCQAWFAINKLVFRPKSRKYSCCKFSISRDQLLARSKIVLNSSPENKPACTLRSENGLSLSVRFGTSDTIYANLRLTSASIPDPDRPHVKNGATTQLATILASGMTEFDYVYDFGDNWEHRIIVEQTGKAETGAKYPRFLGGERCCPPEDRGGPPGYFDFIENIARKSSKKAKGALEWYGGPYDPDDIDVEQINVTLSRIANSYRPGRSKSVRR